MASSVVVASGRVREAAARGRGGSLVSPSAKSISNRRKALRLHVAAHKPPRPPASATPQPLPNAPPKPAPLDDDDDAPFDDPIVEQLTGNILQHLGSANSQSVSVRAEIGKLLLDVRTRLPHGAYRPYLKAHVPFTPTTAQRAVNLHHFRQKRPTRLALLDEAMLGVTSGDVSPLVAGTIYCNAISTCQQAYAINRAREWTTALDQWCSARPQLVTFTGQCQVHRAEIFQIGGDWPAALLAARHVGKMLIKKMADSDAQGPAHYQEAEVHRLRGHFDDAEAAYRAANDAGQEPQPGLALLRLEQGRSDAARSALHRVLSTVRPAWKRARYLPAYIEILLAAGDVAEARIVCDELEGIARSSDTPILGALADQARGAINLEDGDAQAAVEPLRRAFDAWNHVGAPYMCARIRVLLGRAYRDLGDSEGAELELTAAQRVFEALGAAPRLASVGAPSPSPAHGMSPRELEVLQLLAGGETNKAIAKKLFVSERTIDRHVSNIFRKINVSSRAAATAFAFKSGLVGSSTH